MLPLPAGLHAAHQRSQLEAAIGADRVQAALADGLLQRYSAAVLVERRRFADFRTRAAAALLHAGPRAALTGESVFAIAGFASASSAQVEVLLPDAHQVRRRPALVIHSAEFSEIDVEVHQGLRLMTPDFALAELLCRDRGFACLDEALARCPAPRREGLRASVLARIMARPDTFGRSRARFLADLGTGLATSPAESRLRLLAVDAGWPPPHQHYPLRNSSGRAHYRLPLAWPHARVAITTPPDATAPESPTAPAPTAAPEAPGALAAPGATAASGPTTAPGATTPGSATAPGSTAAPGTPAVPGITDAGGTTTTAQDEDLWRRGWTILRPTEADLRNPSRFLADLHIALTEGGLAA